MRVLLLTVIGVVIALLLLGCNKPQPEEEDNTLPQSTGLGQQTPAQPGTVAATPGTDAATPASGQGPLALAAGTSAGQPRDKASLPTDIKAGQQLPTFSITTLDGTTRSIEDFIGKPLMVNFWGIDCPPCKAELPEIVKYYNKYNPQGLEIVSLNVDSTPEEQLEFMKTQPMPWITASDKEGLFKKWGYRGIPTTIFVDAKGVVLEVHLGGMNMDYLEGMKAKLFGEAAPAGPVAPAKPAGPTG
jgi:thiol-disulfide isomerase/thioredoxin